MHPSIDGTLDVFVHRYIQTVSDIFGIVFYNVGGYISWSIEPFGGKNFTGGNGLLTTFLPS